MNDLTMFCMSMNSNHLNFIKEINYVQVGLGKDDFAKEWHRDYLGRLDWVLPI